MESRSITKIKMPYKENKYLLVMVYFMSRSALGTSGEKRNVFLSKIIAFNFFVFLIIRFPRAERVMFHLWILKAKYHMLIEKTPRSNTKTVNWYISTNFGLRTSKLPVSPYKREYLAHTVPCQVLQSKLRKRDRILAVPCDEMLVALVVDRSVFYLVEKIHNP